MDKPSPASQVCMLRESHNMQKNLRTKMYLLKRKFRNRACAKFDTVAMVFRKNENCEAGNYKKKKSHEHGLQKYIYTHEVRIKKKKKKRKKRRRHHALLPD